MGCCTKCCSGFIQLSILVVLLAASFPYFAPKLGLVGEDQRLALISKHNATNQPANFHSRLRINEVEHAGQDYFQWWNFLIFDADTRDHFNIYYDLSEAADGVRVGKVALAHFRGSKEVKQQFEEVSPRFIRHENDFDMYYFPTEDISDKSKATHSLVALDDDTYHLVGNLPDIQWDITIHRVSGYYGGLDTEDPSQCFMNSYLFAYHSTVTGTFTSLGKTYEVTNSPRFRVYAAGSYGCELPTGDPPIEYPWTWFWLIIPGQDTADDIGLCGGTARFGNTPIGTIDGGYSIARLPEKFDQESGQKGFVSSRYSTLFHNTSMAFPLHATASHGYFRDYKVTQENWATFEDDMGSASVPLRQIFEFSSEKFEFVLDFNPTLDQYFRAPVEHKGTIFSDFRAVGARTHVVITDRFDGSTVYDDWIDTLNAVEYAYVAEVNRNTLK